MDTYHYGAWFDNWDQHNESDVMSSHTPGHKCFTDLSG